MADRSERLTNLLATLLDTPRPLPLDEIVAMVPGYPPEHESARRQFERDKDALRGLGVPLDVERDVWGEIVGYRIDRAQYELPELDLTPEERAALHTAVTAMHLESGEGREALWKLGGLTGEQAPTLGALPGNPHLAVLSDASRRRAPIGFRHRGQRRELHPYAVIFRRGHWYVVGYDTARDAVRVFRADRIEGQVELGEPGTFDRPADFQPDAHFHEETWRYGEEPATEALVEVDADTATWLLRQLGDDAVERRSNDRVVVRLTVTNRAAFRSFVLGFLDRAEVLEPPELRQEMIDWLEGVAEATR